MWKTGAIGTYYTLSNSFLFEIKKNFDLYSKTAFHHLRTVANMDRNSYFRDTPNGWIIHQVLLDNLALGEGVPLRVIKLDQLKLLYQNFLEADSSSGQQVFKRYFPTQERFDQFSQKVIDWFLNKTDEEKKDPANFAQLDILKGLYENFSCRIFPVLPGNLHSLEFLAQTMVKYWRIYSLLWLYQQLVLNEKCAIDTFVTLGNVYGLENYRMRYLSVRMREGMENSILLMAGPVFEVEPDVLTNETGVDAVITNKAKDLFDRFPSGISDSNHHSGSNFSQAIHLETVRQNKFLTQRFHNICKIWDLLYNATIVGETKISHKWLRMLTVWAQYVSTITKGKASAPDLIDYILLPSDGLYQTRLGRSVKLTAARAESEWQIAIEAVETKCGEGKTSQSDKFCDLYTRLESKTRQLEKNRLIVMDLWLESRFSALLPDSENNERANDEDNIGYRLAAWICDALRADITEICSYYPEKVSAPLKVHDIYLRHKIHRTHRDGIITALENFSEDKQQRSNIYRALTQGEEQICFNYDPSCPEEICPENSSLIPLNELNSRWPKEKSEMVVPIKFNGRVLGAIEVASFDPWRFRWGQRMLLLNIATSLAAYWYQQRHLGCLSNIQTKVLDFDQEKCDKEALYNAICEQAAVLFLCRGAGLWVRDNINHDLFIRKGEHAVQVGQDELLVSKNDNLISWLVRQPGEQHTLWCEPVLSSSHLTKTNKEQFITAGIKHIAHIPIRAQARGEIIAVLALYDHSERGFDESWRFIAQFFSGHLHVIIESVAAFIGERESVKKMMLHQINDSASHLADKASKIAAPIIRQLTELDKIHSALSTPGIAERFKIAKLMGELPQDMSLSEDLGRIIAQLRNRSVAHNDVKEYATKLRDQLYAFSADFKKDYQADDLRRLYEDEPEKVPGLLQKGRRILAKTSDREFLHFLITEKLLDAEPEYVNLRGLITQVSTSGQYIPKDFSEVDSSIVLNINRNALNTVLTNFWINAQKYRTEESYPIIWSTHFNRLGACILQITNRSRTYSDEALEQLTKKGYQHPYWKESRKKRGIAGGYNAGLGLYFVENLCRHLIYIDFEIKQRSLADDRSEFMCQLLFNPNFLKRGNRYD